MRWKGVKSTMRVRELRNVFDLKRHSAWADHNLTVWWRWQRWNEERRRNGSQRANLYTCQYYKKVFRRQSGNRKRHERTHTVLKPYMCQYFDKCFTLLGNCKKHKHTQERSRIHARLTHHIASDMNELTQERSRTQARLKAAKYEIQKPSTWHATLFPSKFWSMFPVFHLAWSTWSATKTFAAGWTDAALWLVDLNEREQICCALWVVSLMKNEQQSQNLSL